MARRNGTAKILPPQRQLLLANRGWFLDMTTNRPTLTADGLADILRRIRFVAHGALGKAGIQEADLDDLVQDMAIDVLERLPRFDPSKASLRTFASRIAERKLSTLIRHRTRLVRDIRREACSVNGLVDDGDGGSVEFAQTIGQDEQDLRAGKSRASCAEPVDLRLDVEVVLAGLAPELRRLASLLTSCTITEAARELGISRRTLDRRWLPRLRAAFTKHGLALPRPQRASRATPPTGEPTMTLPAVFQKRQDNGSALVSDLSFLIREPADVYHSKTGEFLSSHRLADFRRCPRLFHKKREGLIPDEDRLAYLVGRAAHTLILEGREVYEREYAVGGPINEKTGKPFGVRTQAFEQWAAAQGKPVLTDEQAVLVESLAASVRSHEQATALLSTGVAEGVVRTEYMGEPCQARIDWINPARGLIDLKTADDLDWFEADARRYQYCFQLSFYRSVLAAVTGAALPVFLIATEKREPFRTGVWRLGEDVLGLAQQDNEKAIARLQECRAKDDWPTLFEAVRTFDWL